MPAAIIIGGKSELVYVTAILDRAHAWADLTAYGTHVMSASGDSKIPEAIEKATAKGQRVVVILDSDALQRAREQANTIKQEDVPVYVLSSDFEGAFDPEIIQRALPLLGYQASIECLNNALRSSAVFDGIAECAKPQDSARPLGKTRLAEALGDVSQRYWYFPRELDPVFDAVGKHCGIDRYPPPEFLSWSQGTKGVEADGKLYVCNHVSNARVAYWDFDRRESVDIPLPGQFDGLVAVCRGGSRFVARKHERHAAHGMPTNTWVHVFDVRDRTLESVSIFRVAGSVYELVAQEDGNHLLLCIQTETNVSYGLQCLIDGTKQEKIEIPAAAEMYGPKLSRSGGLIASGPRPMRIMASQTNVAVFPHLYAHSYVWSPRERFLAFFARRWRRPPDFLWLYDLGADQIHRLAAGDQFIPIYWA